MTQESPKAVWRNNIAFFDKFPESEDSGGKTGSGKVKNLEGVDKAVHHYQLKPSILAEESRMGRFKNKRKEGNFDSENFADFIMGNVLTSAFEPDTDGFELAPRMFLAYDQSTHQVGAMSQYLSSGNPDRKLLYPSREAESTPITMDAYYEEITGYKLPKGKHCKVTTDERKQGKKGYLYVGGEENKDIRIGIARVMTGNALEGNFDCNLGNVMIYRDKSGKRQVAVIDGGKSYNRQIRYSWLGGKRGKGNQILDYFNRESIDNLVPTKKRRIPKLWRDYEGLIPSKELADQMKSVAAREENILRGLSHAKQDFISLLSSSTKAGDPFIPAQTKEHVIKSIAALANNIATTKAEKKKIREATEEAIFAINDTAHEKGKTSQDEPIGKLFSVIEKFHTSRLEDMRKVAPLMEVQAGVDKLISDKIKDIKEKGLTASEKDLGFSRNAKGALESGYNSLDDSVKGKWFKTEWEKKPCKGGVEDYLEYRKKQLVKTELAKARDDLDKKIIENLGKEDTTIYEKEVKALSTLAYFGGYAKDSLVHLPAYDNTKAFKGSIEDYVALRTKVLKKELKKQNKRKSNKDNASLQDQEKRSSKVSDKFADDTYQNAAAIKDQKQARRGSTGSSKSANHIYQNAAAIQAQQQAKRRSTGSAKSDVENMYGTPSNILAPQPTYGNMETVAQDQAKRSSTVSDKSDGENIYGTPSNILAPQATYGNVQQDNTYAVPKNILVKTGSVKSVVTEPEVKPASPVPALSKVGKLKDNPNFAAALAQLEKGKEHKEKPPVAPKPRSSSVAGSVTGVVKSIKKKSDDSAKLNNFKKMLADRPNAENGGLPTGALTNDQFKRLSAEVAKVVGVSENATDNSNLKPSELTRSKTSVSEKSNFTRESNRAFTGGRSALRKKGILKRGITRA